MKRTLLGSRAASLVGALLLFMFASTSALAQGNSTVRGTVTDPQGNVVAGATVTLTNTETNFTRTQTTSESGVYVFELIPPGTYRVEVEASGFKKSIVTDVQALVAKPSEVPITLEVGAITESVTVASGSNEVLLNTQDASLGNNFVSQQIAIAPPQPICFNARSRWMKRSHEPMRGCRSCTFKARSCRRTMVAAATRRI